MPNRYRLLCVCAGLFLTLAGCLAGMKLETPEGTFRLSGRRSSGQAGAQLAYRLDEPVRIDGPRQAFFLRYAEATAGSELRLRIDGATHSHLLPTSADRLRTPETTELHIPLAPSAQLDGFDIVSDTRIEPPLAAGIGTLFNGYGIANTATAGTKDTSKRGTATEEGSESGENFAVVVRVGVDRRSTGDGGYLYQFGAATDNSDPQRLFVRIEYEWLYTPAEQDRLPDSGSARVEIGNSDHRRSFALNLRPQRTSVYLYAAWLGFVPSWLRIEPPNEPPIEAGADEVEADRNEAAAGRIDIRTLEIGELDDDDTAIVADMGVILTQRPDQMWRRANWELFAWNLFPSILVLDSRSYAIQARFFKRLAFFAEKRGYRGRVLTNAELVGLSGWRAHNYDAERLAGFFGEAAKQQVELTDEEQLLLRLLLANNIIAPRTARTGSTARTDDYVPLQGGILAVSQESPPLLRQLLLTHESFHGLYVSSAEYRDEAQRIWRALPGEEHAFWGQLLGSLSYDSDYAPLVRDEFQAYLMHYDSQQARGYWQVMVARLNQRLPQQRRATLRLIEANPQLFVRPAAALDMAARRYSGLRAGDVRDLIIVE